MSYSDFLKRYAEYKKIVDLDQLLQAAEYRYAVRCRERGKVYVTRLHNLLTFDIRDVRVLDVGCAYGGISIELARAGAQAAGAEVVPSYIDLARRNANGDADVEFFLGDLTLKSTMEAIRDGRIGKFNLFVINHVLEHIYDTEGLLQNLDRLADDDAVILFDVPNGFAIQSYIAEGHTGTFGVSLADPDTWHYFGNSRARIYYRRLEYFRALLGMHGYTISLVRPKMATRAEMEARLQETITSSREKARLSPAPGSVLEEAMTRFESEVHYDLVHATDDELDLKYFHYFWRGIAYRSAHRVQANSCERIEFDMWGND